MQLVCYRFSALLFLRGMKLETLASSVAVPDMHSSELLL
jgi:hypothetical protein